MTRNTLSPTQRIKVAESVAFRAKQANGNCRVRLLSENAEDYINIVRKAIYRYERDGAVVFEVSGGHCDRYRYTRGGKASYVHEEQASVVRIRLENGEVICEKQRREYTQMYGCYIVDTRIEREVNALLEKLDEVDFDLFNSGISWKTGKEVKFNYPQALKEAKEFEDASLGLKVGQKKGFSVGYGSQIHFEIVRRDVKAFNDLTTTIEKVEKRAQAAQRKAKALFKRGYRLQTLDGVKTLFKSALKPAFWKENQRVYEGVVVKVESGNYVHSRFLDGESTLTAVLRVKGEATKRLQISRERALKSGKTLKSILRWVRRNRIEITRHDASKLGMCDAGVAAFCRKAGIRNGVDSVRAGRLYSFKLNDHYQRRRRDEVVLSVFNRLHKEAR